MTRFDPELLWAELERQPGAAGRCYCVAFSGGLDSTALLVAMARLAPRLASGGLRAVHVDHGLHPESVRWAALCAARCAGLGVPYEAVRVDASAARGESPEASAREARYAALRRRIGPGEALLTAHHADDQVETVLLQLLRGAGVAGLAAMPAAASFGAGLHLRPLLDVPRAALAEWARAQALSGWIEDPANQDTRLARNHLRREVLPAMRIHWPAAARAVARSARHCAEAAALLDELARIDAAACAEGVALRLSGLLELAPARRRNLVRWQLRRLGLPVPDERRLGTLLAQLAEAEAGARPEVRWPGVVATRFAARLWLINESLLGEPGGPRDWPDPREPLALGAGLGMLALAPTTSGGLRADAPEAGPWRVRFRHGGERIRLPGRTGSRALKKLLQAATAPPWLRARMPLLEIAGTLAAVGDQWVDEAWWSPPGTPAWRLRWTGCELPGWPAFVVGEQPF
jgi:tRNA(Ile)-lysidine synthase